MRWFCDMDMVLVHQTGPTGFDKMPWNPGGREIWAAIRDLRPILLTQVRLSRYGLNCEEKLRWIDRELGPVPVIFAPDSRGKGPYARPGDVLIDDSEKHCADWRSSGGTTILHRSLPETLRAIQERVREQATLKP